MIKDHVISNKWAGVINSFVVRSIEDAQMLDEFRSWYTQAETIDDVPEPFRGWIEKGLPARYRKQTAVQKGTVTPEFSIEEIED